MGSVRSTRVGPQISNWVMQQTKSESSFKTELIDLNDWHLPMNDEPHVPATGKYTQEHTKKWAKKIAAADGFIFVTPEYNYGYPAALKNALDHLFQEWATNPVPWSAMEVVEALNQLVS
uniref:NADPH-dependent FMN reductase-like domain-containing protein n=1 Tax=Ditylenchus dipsaci TaxID=166011 RepID=A0A915ERC8_9BILA